MPRLAIGDLTIDLDVPERFACAYSATGSLVAQDSKRGDGFEVSAITGDIDAVAVVKMNALKANVALLHESATHACFTADQTWDAGFGAHYVMATVEGDVPEMLAILTSVGSAHPPFPSDQPISFFPLSASHALWFAQRRSALLEDEGWSSGMPTPASALDDLWDRLLADNPTDEAEVNSRLSAISVAFGDLLARALGFQWRVTKDDWGIALGVIGLEGTANLLVTPDSFIAKRWERREPRFLEAALRSIGETVERARAEWKKPAH